MLFVYFLEKKIQMFIYIFYRYMLNFALSEIPTFKWCLNPICGLGQEHYYGGRNFVLYMDSKLKLNVKSVNSMKRNLTSNYKKFICKISNCKRQI
ncbi:hypothetical protein C2G38_1635273 [Gigaspora rosea]|uniref:Uncharacterized protein n=1 Tax=Gigaspora rosea TaxID=44941 RepID=A0A397UX16_9GLOM|nr:hypothetical protein C2G38_1635273 [Gigaspora rosea]